MQRFDNEVFIPEGLITPDTAIHQNFKRLIGVIQDNPFDAKSFKDLEFIHPLAIAEEETHPLAHILSIPTRIAGAVSSGQIDGRESRIPPKEKPYFTVKILRGLEALVELMQDSIIGKIEWSEGRYNPKGTFGKGFKAENGGEGGEPLRAIHHYAQRDRFRIKWFEHNFHTAPYHIRGGRSLAAHFDSFYGYVRGFEEFRTLLCEVGVDEIRWQKDDNGNIGIVEAPKLYDRFIYPSEKTITIAQGPLPELALLHNTLMKTLDPTSTLPLKFK